MSSIPKILPIFPLAGVILPPGAILPFQIFEPRYLAMLDAVLKNGRYMLMAQPEEKNSDQLFSVGSLGRVIYFDEESPERYKITVLGLQRVRLLKEQTGKQGYRRFSYERKPFMDDLAPDGFKLPDRTDFVKRLAAFLKNWNKLIDWDSFQELDDAKMLLVVMITFPFTAAERQMLLEARSTEKRYELLTALLDMALKENGREWRHEYKILQ